MTKFPLLVIQEILSKKNLRMYGNQGLIEKINFGVVNVSKTTVGEILDYYTLIRLHTFI